MNLEPEKKVLENIITKFNQGHFEKALQDIENIIIDFPNSALCYNILGAIQLEMKYFEKASMSFKKAMSLRNNYFHAINNLGLTYYKKKSYEKAVCYFKQASKFNKDYMDPVLNLSAVYYDINEFQKAKSVLKKIIDLNPNLHKAYYNLSKIYIKLGQINSAIDNLKKAISIDRLQSNYLKDLGNIYLQKGEVETGLNYLKEYLNIFPKSTEVYFYISLLKKYDKNDKILQPIFEFNENELTDDEKIYLFFTYGKIFGDLKNFEKSFFYYEKANLIKNKVNPYDIKNESKLLPILKKHFFNKNYEKISFEKETNCKGTPIFIVGMPRSGTSLIDQILSRHSNIKALGELEYLGNEINKLNLINSEFTAVKGNLLKKNYFRNLDKKDLDRTYFTDKTPINFRWIGYIFNSFSNAKVIHIERNPQATCWSNFKSNFSGEANGFSNNLDNIVKFYLNYQKIMSFYNKLYKNKIHNIKYEDLINNFEKEVKKIISYLNLAWDENCINFHESDRYISTTSFVQVKKKIFFNSSEEWKNYNDKLQNHFNVFE